ncbi:MAG TPA: hypothetical protein VHB99_12760 [Pirellulales bacterium]|nr:hypothetical protein [Pirellulales bacterium]
MKSRAVPKGSRSPARRGRSAIVWTAATWLGLQLALVAAVDQWLPELRDPEFGRKLALLREVRAESASRPLVLLLGSSRSHFGVSPAAFEAAAGSGERQPVLFNFGIMGGGPITQLVLFRQLLAEGVRPEGVLIEINPLMLHQARGFTEESWFAADRLEFRGLLAFRRFVDHPARMYWNWFAARMSSWHAHRLLFMERVAPSWVQAGARQDRRTPPDARGWLRHEPETISAEERRTRLTLQFKAYAPSLEEFSISDAPDRALRELLELCRQERIGAALLVMPEASEMRSAFDPRAQRVLQAFLGELSEEYGAPLFDARNWAGDDEFVDGEHLLPAGAVRFSQRLLHGTEEFLAQIGQRPADSLQSSPELAEKPGAARTRQ